MSSFPGYVIAITLKFSISSESIPALNCGCIVVNAFRELSLSTLLYFAGDTVFSYCFFAVYCFKCRPDFFRRVVTFISRLDGPLYLFSYIVVIICIIIYIVFRN